MKAKLEETPVQHRGVVLTSETVEERNILWDIWSKCGRPVSVSKMNNRSIELVIAPSAEEENESS